MRKTTILITCLCMLGLSVGVLADEQQTTLTPADGAAICVALNILSVNKELELLTLDEAQARAQWWVDLAQSIKAEGFEDKVNLYIKFIAADLESGDADKGLIVSSLNSCYTMQRDLSSGAEKEYNKPGADEE